jgi:NADP-dependent 3-hydroxy acid dehydrogenase YdfG
MTHPQHEPLLVVASGGARGITARCIVVLARRYGWQFVLLGRTSTDEPLPAWARAGADEVELKAMLARELAEDPGRAVAPVRPAEIQRRYEDVRARLEIEATLQAVALAGGDAEYVCADVADEALRERLRPAIDRRGGVVSGVVHGAGVLADRRLEDKRASDFVRVFAPKVRGLRALLDSLDEDALRFVVLFSSAAAFYGNPGQADYAIANEVLNKAAYRLRRRLPRCRVVAFDWAPWAGGDGMVTPELQSAFEARGIELVEPESGAAIVADVLAPAAAPPAQLLVGSSFPAPTRPLDDAPRTHRIARRLAPDANPFLDDHVIGGRRVLPVTCAMAWIVDACEGRYPGLYAVRLAACRVLGGVVFDGGEVRDLTLELDETARDVERLEVRLDAAITGAGHSGRRQPLYSAEVVLARERPAPVRETAGAARTSGHLPTGESPYLDGTLFHGPSFRGIERILAADDDGLELECRLPSVPTATQGQFRVGSVNPYVADALFQALVVWVRRTCGTASLPVATATATLFRPLAFDRLYTVSVAVRERRAHHVVADLAARDAADEVQLRLEAAEVALSPSLVPLFEVAGRA